MEPVYSFLTTRARELQERAEGSEPGQSWRALIVLAGPPGSGKTTVAAGVVRRLNSGTTSPRAAVVSMDGFHYPRAVLDTFPNVAEAYARRGAAWTFDAEAVVRMFSTLDESRKQPRDQAGVIYLPSFDHAVKDPVADDISIPPSVSLVILEGNWLLYDEEPWRRISKLVDETWFIDVDRNLARDRVARRHIRSGIETSWEAAIRRAETNDVPNGEDVRRKLIKPDVTVQSVEEPALVTGNGEAGLDDITELLPQ
ncbi:P-loop containing nucleoside triphosphate hydrolase protein [Xylariaceae sp. FL0662B]|nr:P-loop containing nucleoside triphosphate hydrolase protein [Xylariaceae sp. FL0662B]